MLKKNPGKTVSTGSKTRPLTILAQDPSLLFNKKPLFTSVSVPAEELAAGPCGYRIRVIDYDASTGTLYKPLQEHNNDKVYVDQFEGKDPDELLNDPLFHQQNVYAIAMRVLSRFEYALGRRVSWQFETHQLKIVPHAFREANAYYSRTHEALLFGYFARRSGQRDSRIYTCLSHDIVAHETTHAILDGLRQNYLYTSQPDQPAFHEGFSDIVALLSVLSIRDVVESVIKIQRAKDNKDRDNIDRHVTVCNTEGDNEFQSKSLDGLQNEIELIKPLVTLATEMGKGMGDSRGQALRNSLKIKPDRAALTKSKYQSPHSRGEVLVAAVLRATLKIAKRRALKLGVPGDEVGCSRVSIQQIAESFSKSARDVLNICIRGLDYLVPVHVTFNDYLDAILTADFEVVGDDSTYGYRRCIRESFLEFGIGTSSGDDMGLLRSVSNTKWLRADRTDYHEMTFNKDEMFRYLWENKQPLGISDQFYTRVTAVNPSIRVGPEGMLISETVVEYVQSATLRGGELNNISLRRPSNLGNSQAVTIFGGGTLIFDVRGQLKYHIRSSIDDPSVQNPIIQRLADSGEISSTIGVNSRNRLSFSHLHQQRAYKTHEELVEQELWP